MEYFDDDQDHDGTRTPPLLSPSLLPQDEVPEVSMVEQEDVTGVTFTPEYVYLLATLLLIAKTSLTPGYGCSEENGP